MSPDTRRLRTVRGLALIIGALSLVVVAVSAYLRLDAAGLGCVDWPACYGRILSQDLQPLHYGYPRLLHRFAASAALVLTCVLVWRCLRPQPLLPAARHAVLLLLLMLALSALGFFSADPRRALVGFLNIIGGLGLVTFSWRVAMAAASSAAYRGGHEGVAKVVLLRVGVFALTITVVLGAWIGATYSASACLTLPLCEANASLSADAWRVMDPLVKLTAAGVPGEAGGALLHLLHRGFALTVLLTLGWAAAANLKQSATRPSAVAVLGFLVAVAGLGGAAVMSGLSLLLVVGHGVVAALLLAAVAALLRHQRK
jgi:cytochrome c oxidase assembly protein subunit 15